MGKPHPKELRERVVASGGLLWLGTLHSPISPIAVTPRLYGLFSPAVSAPNAC